MSLAPSVLVTSVGSGVGYGVLHAFRRAARRYRVIGANCEAVAAGNFRCDRLHLMPPTSDADAYLEALDRVLARERPELLVPGHDSELPLLAGHRHALEQRHGCRVVVASSEVIRVSNDKLESARFFGECFAATVAADDADGIERLIAGRGFPLLVKPRFGYASRGVRLAFDRAGLEAALTAESPSVENLRDGVELTLKQLTAAFGKFNLNDIDPLGEKFDPHLHQAIQVVESDQPANTVVTVLQKGYRLNERTLRPALVMVAKGSGG